MNDKTDTGAKPRQNISLDKMKGLQTDSIAIRFSASSFKDDDDDDLDIFTNASRSSSNEALKFVMKEETPTDESIHLPSTNHCRSSSAPASEVTTPSKPEAAPPVPSIANNNSIPSRLSDRGKESMGVAPYKEEVSFERSFMSGIRERLQEPLSSIRDRIEVLKTESPLVESIERRLRKTDSLDSSSDSRNSSRVLGIKAQSRLSRTRHGSLDLEGPTLSTQSGTVPNDLNGLAERDPDSTPKSVPKSMSSDSIDRAKIQPISKKELQLTPDPSDRSPMSLSHLLSKSDSHQAITEEASEFFDPEEDVHEKVDGGEVKAEEEPPAETEEPPPDYETPVKPPKPSIPLKHRILAGLVAFIAYVVIPLPEYVSGVVTGMMLASLLIWFYFTYYAPPTLKQDHLLPALKSLPPLKVPEMRESTNFDNNFKGWLNELYKYNVESYHISHTHSIYVTLEGSQLRLQTPKQNISRQALHDDSFAPCTFVHQRHFDLSNSRVFLLPNGLIKKRLWSKKYPICIIPGKNSRSPDMNGADDSSSNSEEGHIFLFGRTCREKEEWFRRFYAVSVGSRWPTRTSDLVLNLYDLFKVPLCPDPLKPLESPPALPAEGKASLEESLQAYLGYMAHVMPKDEETSEQQINWSIEGLRRKQCDPQILWVNALISRLFWDFLREQYWCDKMREKLQKKLSKIHVPYFINELTVTGIELGSEVPFINRASKPYLDDRGLWVDLDILYQGGFYMILETKCNLMKLKKKDVSMEEKAQPMTTARSAWTDSDEEDSAESSTDEEEDKPNIDPTISDDGKNATGGGQRKFLRIVDRITQSKYFQQATEYKYIKKAMEGVSNTRLELKVELRRLCGTMSVNIPHPPSDRIWYGFRSPPHFNLSAVPKVGEREFNVSQITDWIEKKLTLEFQRVFVYPNMDDLVIPLMCDAQTASSR